MLYLRKPRVVTKVVSVYDVRTLRSRNAQIPTTLAHEKISQCTSPPSQGLGVLSQLKLVQNMLVVRTCSCFHASNAQFPRKVLSHYVLVPCESAHRLANPFGLLDVRCISHIGLTFARSTKLSDSQFTGRNHHFPAWSIYYRMF